MNDLEIRMVLRYIDEYLPEPHGLRPKNLAAERSYARWSAYEIVRRLTEHPFDPPEDIVDLFILELTTYVLSDAQNDRDGGGVFQAARDTAMDIRCLLT